MVEVRGSFGTFGEWSEFQSKLGDFASLRRAILEDVRRLGLTEPLTGFQRAPYEITVNENNLHESLSAGGLNSRKRALLAQFQLELKRRGLLGNLALRILGSDAVSGTALVLSGRYPYFLGLELETSGGESKHCPVQTSDFQTLRLR